ncbi:MAG: hypothetical protein CFE31_09240 [Rhizobiales bacterium PAR1]|nr:MAG: hypothetical protein CFE31_09240 [Rhizobiales bacterium PAR1]
MAEPTEATIHPPGMLDEAQIFARFILAPDDSTGLLAYALHRRALLAFRADFDRTAGRGPEPAEEAAFLVGELSEPRLASYRAEASSLALPTLLPVAPPKRKARWPFFGLWVDAPLAPSGEPGTINWRGLMWRFAILLASVITTAVLLRVLVVKA